MSSHQPPINKGDDAPNNQAVAAAPHELQIVEEIPDPNSHLVHCITQRQESPTKKPSKEDEEEEDSLAASAASPPPATPDRNNNGNNNTTTLQDSTQPSQDQEEPPQDKAANRNNGDGDKVLDAQPQDLEEPPQDKVANCDVNKVEPPRRRMVARMATMSIKRGEEQ
jgi:hypothetical protein